MSLHFKNLTMSLYKITDHVLYQITVRNAFNHAKDSIRKGSISFQHRYDEHTQV